MTQISAGTIKFRNFAWNQCGYPNLPLIFLLANGHKLHALIDGLNGFASTTNTTDLTPAEITEIGKSTH
ncbi:1388_t:CDS:2 [Ambispora leptoticha]|uniref:1388_t:CDS:1 n=1 Tax=Ambispora leptoticha TaxID=144679 RepID=A0A9N9ERK1_9GLOM|nr:1388_t:CDS:2 [Ambispora leptoticha]